MLQALIRAFHIQAADILAVDILAVMLVVLTLASAERHQRSLLHQVLQVYFIEPLKRYEK